MLQLNLHKFGKLYKINLIAIILTSNFIIFQMGQLPQSENSPIYLWVKQLYMITLPNLYTQIDRKYGKNV